MSLSEDQKLSFGDLLRRARRAAGLTQEELAERAGLSTRGISDLERGIHHAPHQDTVDLLLNALDLPEEERDLWQRIRQRHALRGMPEPAAPVPRFPHLLTPLVGRERETRIVEALLTDPAIRLVTLTGTGGIGKTRLAIAVAREVSGVYPGGAHFVGLSSIRDPALVIPAIATTLSVNEAGDQPLLTTLSAFIAERRILLVLDNFEQVVDAARDVGALLSHCPHLHVLATSRVPLRLSGEHEYVLAPLHVPGDDELTDHWRLRECEAVELFLQRARAARSSFDLTAENSGAVGAICRRLDGLPLAIELAAARVKVLSPQEIMERLEEPLALLTGGARDLPERQRTMRDTIRWSYDLLQPREQALFRLLSAFVGGWSLEAAEAVTRSDDDVLDSLTVLIDSNLVLQSEQADGETRFQMLEMVREFGLEQIQNLGEAQQAFQQHARYILDLAEESEQAIRDDRQPVWFARLALEQGNIRAVLQRSLVSEELDPDTGRRLAATLVWYWFTNNHFREARDWLQLASAAPQSGQDTLWARATVGHGMMRWRLREIPEAQHLVSAGLDVLREADDPWHTMFAVHQLAHLADEAGDSERAVRLFQESMQGARDIDDEWGVAAAHSCLGRTLEMLGRTDEARSELQQAIEMFQVLGDGWFAATSIQRLGDVEFDCGNYDASATWYRLGLRRSAALGDELAIADVLISLGQIEVARGRPERAARLLAAARSIHDSYDMALFGPLRPAYEQTIASITISLGREHFDRIWEEGRRMIRAEAVTYALDGGNLMRGV